MGKGKKKGGQKGLGQGDSKDQEKVEAQTSELSLDEKPSTSAAAEPVPSASTEVPEEEEGLGLGGPRKKNKPRKKKSAAAAAVEPAAEPADQPAAGSAPAQSVPPQAWPGTIPVQQPRPSQQSWSAPSPTAQGPQPRPDPAWSVGARQQSAPAGPAPAPWGGPAAPPEAQQPQPQQKPQSPSAAELIPSPSGSTKNFPISSSRGRGLGQPIEPKVTGEIPPYTRRKEVICRYRIPERVPGNQVRFTPIKVLTNYLPFVFKPIKIYRYDVSFKPERPKKFLPQAFKLVEKEYYAREFIAFDQIKNCYSLHQLKNVPNEGRFGVNVDIQDSNGKKLTFEVSLKFTGIVDLANLTRHMQIGGSSLTPASEEIQCIDVILRHGALESYVKCGRQFFKRPSNPVNLTGGLEMWTGLFQSAIFTSRGFINIDVAHKGFPIQQNLVAALEDSFRLKPNYPLEEQRGDVENFRAFIKNLRVTAKLLGTNQSREFICNDVLQPPDKTFFTITRGDKEAKISVLEYFAKEKNYRIKYPRLNCVWVGPRDKNIYYPMELLDVVYGQASSKQLTEMQISTMVRQAATPPDERKRKIEECARAMNYSNNVFFKKFGFEISDKFFEVDAKVLQAPTIDIGDARSEIPRNGVWQAKRLLKPESLIHWGFAAIDCDCRSSNFETIRALILSNGRQLGMRVAEPRLTKFQVKISEFRSVLLKAVEEKINFMFVIVSRYGRDIYHRVKQIAETDVGILTQCIKEHTAANKMNPQTIRNILLKVNSKLMGVNQSLDTRSLPRCMQGGGVMIIGADVTHPSPDQSNIPSIAAVTASLDPKCFMYNIELSIQTPKKEMIVQFEDMILDHLKVYRKRNGQLPKKMYIFRDGVSEGQFAEVMNSELAAVHSAYAKLVLNVKPEVMFLLVQKRHHTRLFLGSSNSANVAPGTVVDTHIVHPKELDFYLVSHQAIKGTARPTRYHSVCNDGRVPDDEVQQLAYYLCHLYARCPRAVSYPTPTYYAHLACLRARSLTYGRQFDNRQLETQPQRLRVLDKMLEFSRMFFV